MRPHVATVLCFTLIIRIIKIAQKLMKLMRFLSPNETEPGGRLAGDKDVDE